MGLCTDIYLDRYMAQLEEAARLHLTAEILEDLDKYYAYYQKKYPSLCNEDQIEYAIIASMPFGLYRYLRKDAYQYLTKERK